MLEWKFCKVLDFVGDMQAVAMDYFPRYVNEVGETIEY